MSAFMSNKCRVYFFTKKSKFFFLSPNPFQSFPLSDFPLLLSPIYAYQNVFFFSVLSLFATAGYLLVTPLTLLPPPNPFYYFSRGITVRRYLASPPAT